MLIRNELVIGELDRRIVCCKEVDFDVRKGRLKMEWVGGKEKRKNSNYCRNDNRVSNVVEVMMW